MVFIKIKKLVFDFLLKNIHSKNKFCFPPYPRVVIIEEETWIIPQPAPNAQFFIHPPKIEMTYLEAIADFIPIPLINE